MNVAKKRTFPGYEDGPGQKRLAHTSKQDGQAQGCCLPLYREMKVRKLRDACTESIWSGTLKFHTRPQSQSNDQKQAMVIGCRLHSQVLFGAKINTVNWPKQLNMTTISADDCWKLICNVYVESPRFVAFSMYEDCDKMSYRAFIQSTSKPNRHGCVLLEYTSSGIWLLKLTSYLLGDENVTVGWIRKYTHQDRVVEFLADLGILSHATTANMLAKENASLKEELQRKDKMLIEQQTLHREKVEMLKTRMTEEEARMQRERDVMEKQIIKKDGTIFQKDSALFLKNSALKEKDQALMKKDEALMKKDEALMKKDEALMKKDEALMKKDEALMKKDEAISERDEALVVKETDIMEKDNTIMTVEQEKDELQQENNEIETRCSELENTVHTIKQATLDDIEKEFMCTICQHTFTKAKTLNCGHSFCTKCIEDKRMLTKDGKARPCPNCLKPRKTNIPSLVIDSCIEKINRLRDEARQTGDETEMESEEELIQGELEVPSQSVSEESDDDPSPVSSPSSIENVFSSASSSDSD